MGALSFLGSPSAISGREPFPAGGDKFGSLRNVQQMTAKHCILTLLGFRDLIPRETERATFSSFARRHPKG